ncbi:MAG TPA: lasso peptide biosynthesis B2 protein [Candidatus Acidoferrales bacterium]
MSSWQKLRALNRSDWGVLFECVWVIPAVEFNIRWRSPKSWLPAVSDSAPPPASPASSAAADRVAHLVDAVYRRLPFEPTCLTRSLALYRLLRARGIPCQLRIGLRKNQAALEGHAWTESGRTPLDADGFEVMLSF